MMETFIQGNVYPYQQRIEELEAETIRLRSRVSEVVAEANASYAEASGFRDILMSICALLELPRSESGPCDDVNAYEQVIEGLKDDLARTETERVEHSTARYKAEADLQRMTMDRDSWRREFDLYAKAWLRELGGKLVPKSHRIDALVVTTRQMKETHDRLVREEAERRRAADVAEYGPFVARGAANG